MRNTHDAVRRRVTVALGAGLLVRRAKAAPRHRVIVVGAGFGGATCAKYLERLSPGTEVLLVDRRGSFFTGPFTNAVIAGLRPAGRITRNVAAIGRAHGIAILQADVVGLDPTRLEITTATGARHRADRLVVAPGIALRYGTIDGLDAARNSAMPHAWLGDAQVPVLRDRLRAVPDGGTVLIAAPPNPFRCPPGPYERASLMAWVLKASGRRRTKIIVADCKDDFSKSALFKLEWDVLYPGMIEWISRSDGGEVDRVDTTSGKVWLRGAQNPVATDLASIIPAQSAGALAAAGDLVDESGWCPVDAGDFSSLRHPGVHVIGDACAGAPIPKSAFAANSQAKLCASAIAAAFSGAAAPTPRLLNTCYSLVSDTRAISVSGLYASAAGKLAIVSEGMSPLAGDAQLRAAEGRQALAWYDNITADSFGDS